MKSLAVVAAGAGLAFVLAAAALWAALASFGSRPADWSAVEGTRMLLTWTAVVLVHLVWIATWCVCRGLGWARCVAAFLLLPVTGLVMWLVAMSVWEVSTGAGMEGSSGRSPMAQEPAVTWPGVAVILVPAVVVAVAVLMIVLVPARVEEDSMFVRPAWEPRTILRRLAVTMVALGSVVLAVILVFLLLAMTGLV